MAHRRRQPPPRRLAAALRLGGVATFLSSVALEVRGQNLRGADQPWPDPEIEAAGLNLADLNLAGVDEVEAMTRWYSSQSTGSWIPLGDHVVADDEGGSLFSVIGNLDFCKKICSNYQGCRSFAFCESMCFLKGGAVDLTTPHHNNTFCTTYYWSAETVTTTSAPPSEDPYTVCKDFQADLSMSVLQEYDGNPEADIRGTVRLWMCTNGTFQANLTVKDGFSEIIATQVHHCQRGPTPQTSTGVMCWGPPVVNFCGINGPGYIQDGADYTSACEGYNATTGESVNRNLQGVLVPALGLTHSNLVLDMIEHPETYYFSVHSLASYNHWHPESKGVARGMLSIVLPPTTTTMMPAIEEDSCFNLYSRLEMNELQAYRGNADAKASGYASFNFCTNGTMTATILIFGGVSEIIATDVQRCEGGDTVMTQTAEMCEGRPVIAFCGKNAPGYLDVGVEYSKECARYSDRGSSRTEHVPGVVIPDETGNTNTAALVWDIISRPNMYFFNVHSLDSYGHWYPQHLGMCRGAMNVW